MSMAGIKRVRPASAGSIKHHAAAVGYKGPSYIAARNADLPHIDTDAAFCREKQKRW